MNSAPSARTPLTGPRRGRSPEADVARLLLAQGLLRPAEVLDEGLRLSATQRERATTVTVRLGTRGLYMVKRAHPGALDWSAREIRCYRAVSAGASFGRIAPALVHADATSGVLVTGLFDPARTLHDLCQARGIDMEDPPRALGEALATLHALNGPEVHALAPVAPWILDGASPERDAHLAALFPAAMARSAILDHIGHGAGLWRAECLVHGDAKLDNCLLLPEDDGRGRAVRLVDWELAGIGDPAWDVATAMQEFLVLALTDTSPPVRLDTMLRGPAARPMAALCARYLDQAGGTAAWREAMVTRISAFLGCRMLQSACEFAAMEGDGGIRAQGARALALDMAREPAATASALRRLLRPGDKGLPG